MLKSNLLSRGGSAMVSQSRGYKNLSLDTNKMGLVGAFFNAGWL